MVTHALSSIQKINMTRQQFCKVTLERAFLISGYGISAMAFAFFMVTFRDQKKIKIGDRGTLLFLETPSLSSRGMRIFFSFKNFRFTYQSNDKMHRCNKNIARQSILILKTIYEHFYGRGFHARPFLILDEQWKLMHFWRKPLKKSVP